MWRGVGEAMRSDRRLDGSGGRRSAQRLDRLHADPLVLGVVLGYVSMTRRDSMLLTWILVDPGGDSAGTPLELSSSSLCIARPPGTARRGPRGDSLPGPRGSPQEQGSEGSWTQGNSVRTAAWHPLHRRTARTPRWERNRGGRPEMISLRSCGNRVRAPGSCRDGRPEMTWIRRSSWRSPTSHTSPPRRRPRPSASSPP
jgi:hypothetical protein